MVEEPVLPGRAMPSRGRSVEDLPLGSSVVLGDGSAAEEPANAIVQDGLAEEGLSPSAAMLPEVSSDGLAEPEVHGRPTFQSLEKTGDAIRCDPAGEQSLQGAPSRSQSLPEAPSQH